MFHPPVELVLEFLLLEFRSGKLDGSSRSFRSMGVIRSALSAVATIDGVPVGQHRFVRQFMKAVFNERPALPRYKSIWDPDIVLGFLRDLGPNDGLALLDLSRKLAILMLLLSGQRGQTLLALDLDHMRFGDINSKVFFGITDVLKTSRPGSHLSEISFDAYPPDSTLCVIKTLLHYLQVTSVLRGNVRKLFIISRRPYSAASRGTIGRWVKTCLSYAGIDISVYAAGSTRQASSSKASLSLPVDTILAAVGWSQGSTFATFYKKPLRQGSFSGAVMSTFA